MSGIQTFLNMLSLFYKEDLQVSYLILPYTFIFEGTMISSGEEVVPLLHCNDTDRERFSSIINITGKWEEQPSQ